MIEQKLYKVKFKSQEGTLRDVIITSKSLIQSFSTDAKKIMFELRVDDLKSFNELQALIGIRQTNELQTLWTSELEKIDLWFDDSDNLMFFINKYANAHNSLLGTYLNIKVEKIQKNGVTEFVIDDPIDHNKYDFDKRQPRTVANQNLQSFKHYFFNYIMSLYSMDEKQVDWKLTKYSHTIAENIAYKLMELGYLGIDFQVADKLFDEFTNNAYNDNERNYKDIIRQTVQKIQNKKLLVRDKNIIAKMLFDIGIQEGLIDSKTNQLTDKALDYIEENKQK